jgi:ABC-type amino acid transport substrate-binding protein
MRKLGLWMPCAMLLLVLILVGCGGGGALRIGVDATNPPFEYLTESGELTGFDVALMEAVAAEAGFEFEWVQLTFREFQEALAEGSVDLAISGNAFPIDVAEGVVVYTETVSAMESELALSDAFFVSRQTVYRRSNRDSVERIGYQSGRLAFSSDDDIVESYEFQGYPTLQDAVVALQSEEVDAVLAPEHQMEFTLSEMAVTLESTPIGWTDYWIAVRKDLNLVDSINVALQTVIDNGTYATLYSKWSRKVAPYAYRPAELRDEAVSEQATQLLALGSQVMEAILGCLTSGETLFCAPETAQEVLDEASAMDVNSELEGLRGNLVSFATVYSTGTLSDLAELNREMSRYKEAADKVRATFQR